MVMKRGRVRAPVRDAVLDWLLEPDQPSIRYLSLTQLVEKSETDSEVREAKARIPSAGWAAATSSFLGRCRKGPEQGSRSQAPRIPHGRG